jgi:hypothetical protein
MYVRVEFRQKLYALLSYDFYLFIKYHNYFRENIKYVDIFAA